MAIYKSVIEKGFYARTNRAPSARKRIPRRHRKNYYNCALRTIGRLAGGWASAAAALGETKGVKRLLKFAGKDGSVSMRSLKGGKGYELVVTNSVIYQKEMLKSVAAKSRKDAAYSLHMQAKNYLRAKRTAANF